MKVNAMLDVARVLGLKERYQTVIVNVLNNEIETF